ncbi:MAG: hypothetical protein IJX76_08225 [Clostridia bacterium]|nr:hypothetical protein [Clostridia bacterium]
MNLKKFSVKMATACGLSFSFGYTLVYVIDSIQDMMYFSHADYWVPRILIRFGISLLAGPLFGVFFYFAIKKRRTFALSQLVPEAADAVTLDMPANLAGRPAVPGWFFLTDKALIFTATRKKQLQFTRTFLLSDITSALPLKSALQPKLQLTLTNGDAVQFSVNKPEEWATRINEATAHSSL